VRRPYPDGPAAEAKSKVQSGRFRENIRNKETSHDGETVRVEQPSLARASSRGNVVETRAGVASLSRASQIRLNDNPVWWSPCGLLTAVADVTTAIYTSVLPDTCTYWHRSKASNGLHVPAVAPRNACHLSSCPSKI
jgi:hypothetical protein